MKRRLAYLFAAYILILINNTVIYKYSAAVHQNLNNDQSRVWSVTNISVENDREITTESIFKE